MPRPQIHGRSIVLGEEKLHVRGVTYGTFRSVNGCSFPAAEQVRRDFAAMIEAGANAFRTYVPPPLWLLDLAVEHGLRAMVGLAWEQHVAFLDDPGHAGRIAARVAAQVRECEAHPAILCYSVGNEIPAPIVRWHGKREVEKFLERLYSEAKTADPTGLITYVNYPSTEYLELPFLDLAAFNVFLEEEAAFESYLARLQNLSADRPLLITEAGADSRRIGERAQAQALGWQVRHTFGTGAAGVFIFSWTDEWHRGGHDVEDWDFGLVDRERRPKPALAAIRRAFSAVPFAASEPWPRVSVVVCTHNGEATLGKCLQRLGGITYPDFETIVVDDGSTDRSAEIARAHGASLVETEHLGLSHARNAGISRATGEVVAFLDDDAYPDPDWLHHLAAALRADAHAGVGGPNIPPADDGLIADCVAAAPGGPIHVLLSDREAEHLPGCNMAFRKTALEEVGGFDERFRVAGDDVDVCWRLQKAGHTLGFSAGAVVIHRRRDSVRRYLRQQYGYGKAEALLERKWPERYNRAGSSRWSGRIYDPPAAIAPGGRAVVNYGTWGNGLFQSIYGSVPGTLSGFVLAPEVLLLIAALAAMSALGTLWTPLLAAIPPLLTGLAVVLWQALSSGWHATPPVPGRSRAKTLRRRGLTATLFLLQPPARLAGRLRGGLSPWRRRSRPSLASPRPRTVRVWSESWRSPESWVQELQDALAVHGGFVRSGGPFDRWDLDLRAGLFAGVKIRTAVEEHGSGRQLMRVRIWPRASVRGPLIVAVIAILSALAWLAGHPGFGILTAIAVLGIVGLGIEGIGTAMRLTLDQLARMGEDGRAHVGEPVQAALPRLAAPPAQRLEPPLHPIGDPNLALTGQATLSTVAEEVLQ